jgi:dTDP-4-amino-4,6-dideoxygalactose transaminase
MMHVPFLDLSKQFAQIREDVLARLGAVCHSGRFVLGPEVEEFERSFARYCEAGFCVAVNSGTSALHLALLALGVRPGDEVVTTPMTFVATAWAVSYVGATPVFVDIDPATRTLDPDKLQAALTSRTRAILPVHLYGQPADLEPILRVASGHGLPVVEDAAQAHGARYQGRRVGGLGRAGCFSFYPAKNLGAFGEGGALVTNDAELAQGARMLRNHAQMEKYRHECIGFNYRMDAFQGAVLGIKLARLDGWNERRRAHAARYRERLEGVPALGLPAALTDRESVCHLFVVEVDGRDWVARQLQAAGIETGLHYPIPVHLQPAYRHLGLGPGSFPVAERLAQRCLSLPMFPELADEQIDYVCATLAALLADGKPRA